MLFPLKSWGDISPPTPPLGVPAKHMVRLFQFSPLKTLLRLNHSHSDRLRTIPIYKLTFSLTLPCYIIICAQLVINTCHSFGQHFISRYIVNRCCRFIQESNIMETSNCNLCQFHLCHIFLADALISSRCTNELIAFFRRPMRKRMGIY